MNAKHENSVVMGLISVIVLFAPALSGGGDRRGANVIGTPSRGLFEFPAVVAIRKGFYKDEGLTRIKSKCNRPLP